MEYLVEAANLRKNFGKKLILQNIDLNISAGEIVGVVGANGAGKSTLLKGILGLTRVEGQLKVCGLDPYAAQHHLMNKVSFVADTAVLPKWITPKQLFDYTATIHPQFNRVLAEQFLENSEITPAQKVQNMSKGMITQLHLALAIAVNSELLVLDEPSLGLDLLRRKHFYEKLLQDHFDDNNTIIITTHQVEEIEHILTRLIYLENGKVMLDIQVDDLPQRFLQLTTRTNDHSQALAMKPIQSIQTLGGMRFIFDGLHPDQIAHLGEVSTPNLSNIILALMEQKQRETEHA